MLSPDRHSACTLTNRIFPLQGGHHRVDERHDAAQGGAARLADRRRAPLHRVHVSKSSRIGQFLQGYFVTRTLFPSLPGSIPKITSVSLAISCKIVQDISVNFSVDVTISELRSLVKKNYPD